MNWKTKQKNDFKPMFYISCGSKLRKKFAIDLMRLPHFSMRNVLYLLGIPGNEIVAYDLSGKWEWPISRLNEWKEIKHD